MSEKPLALNFAEARIMYRAAEEAGVRHMTAFTYRFVPAMRYMKHLVDAATSARRSTSAPSASRIGATATSAGGRSKNSPAQGRWATCSRTASTTPTT
jgi:predicted dehydrogenase